MLVLLFYGFIFGVSFGICMEILDGLIGEGLLVALAAVFIVVSTLIEGPRAVTTDSAFPAVFWVGVVAGIALQVFLGGDIRERLQTDDGTPFVWAMLGL